MLNGKIKNKFYYFYQITLTDIVILHMLQSQLERFMDEFKISSDLIRGHIDTIILSLLTKSDKYGYEITRLILEASGGEFELKEATMYSSLKRMEKDD